MTILRKSASDCTIWQRTNIIYLFRKFLASFFSKKLRFPFRMRIVSLLSDLFSRDVLGDQLEAEYARADQEQIQPESCFHRISLYYLILKGERSFFEKKLARNFRRGKIWNIALPYCAAWSRFHPYSYPYLSELLHVSSRLRRSPSTFRNRNPYSFLFRLRTV